MPVSTPEVAEMAKLLENIFRSVNIALVNELAMLCDRMKIDVWEVIEAAGTKPFGFMPFQPGPGPWRPLHPDRPLLPVLEGARVRLLDRVHRARRQGQREHALLLRAEGAQRSQRAAQEPCRSARAGAGVAYKADIDDLRESPALKVIRQLLGTARWWTTTMRYVPELPRAGAHLGRSHRRRPSPATTRC